MSSLLAMQSPIKNLTKINEPMQRGLAAAESVFGLIDTEAEADTGTKKVERAVGRLALEEVSFHYGADADAKPALDRVSLDIAAGETVALVGSSGSGKTTLAGLLPRFYDVSGGSIKLDGVDLRDYTMASLRQQIALVSQDVVLFNDTLAANIAYGDPEPSMQRIEAAARAAHAHEFIERQPNGYQTSVGENGLRLSGGQRQRLAIARAVQERAHPDPRRSHQRAGHGIGTPGAGGIGSADAGPHHGGHRAPPVDHRKRRPHRGAGPGPHRGGGRPRYAAGARRHVCAPVPDAEEPRAAGLTRFSGAAGAAGAACRTACSVIPRRGR